MLPLTLFFPASILHVYLFVMACIAVHRRNKSPEDQSMQQNMYAAAYPAAPPGMAYYMVPVAQPQTQQAQQAPQGQLPQEMLGEGQGPQELMGDKINGTAQQPGVSPLTTTPPGPTTAPAYTTWALQTTTPASTNAPGQTATAPTTYTDASGQMWVPVTQTNTVPPVGAPAPPAPTTQPIPVQHIPAQPIAAQPTQPAQAAAPAQPTNNTNPNSTPKPNQAGRIAAGAVKFGAKILPGLLGL